MPIVPRSDLTPIYGNKQAGTRPRQTTLLKKWLEARDLSAFELARRLSVDPKTVLHLAQGRQLPSLILAFRIEQVTEGGVSAESWLGTELGRIRWNMTTFDWDGWLGRKAEATARHDAARKTPKRKR